MTPAERAEREANAERAKRRGDMGEALRLLEEVARAFPDDTPLRDRIALLKDTLQPMELMNPKAKFEPVASNRPATPEQEGERLFALGDYVSAAAAYRRALQLKPDSELLKERLYELFQLAQTAPKNSPTDAALPKKPDALLQALLDRIAARRR